MDWQRYKIHIGLLLIILVTTVFSIHYLDKTNTSTITDVPQTRRPVIINGSIPYWDQVSAVESFQSHAAEVNQLALFWYYLNDQGRVTKYEYAEIDASILAHAKQNNIKTLLTITNLGEREDEDWDSVRVEQVLKDEASRKKHIDDILSIVHALHFDGVNIDYEEVAASQRENFSRFIGQLSHRLHDEDKLLSVALHPIFNEESEQRYYFQDYPQIAHAADFVTVMAYGEHYDEGQPGPIASTAWLLEIIEYMKSKAMPLQKVLLGVPLYGYDWSVDSPEPAVGLTYQTTQQLLARVKAEPVWDEEAGAPYFHYTSNGQDHEVWFEDTRSVEQKIRLAQTNGLAGVAFWRLGGEDPGIWNSIGQFK